MDPENTGTITFEQFSTVCHDLIEAKISKHEGNEVNDSIKANDPVKDSDLSQEEGTDGSINQRNSSLGGDSVDSDDAGGFNPEDYESNDSEEENTDSDVDKATRNMPERQSLRDRKPRANLNATSRSNEGYNEGLISTRDHVFGLMQNGKCQITSASLKRVTVLLKFTVSQEDLRQMVAMGSNNSEFKTLWELLKM